MMELGIYGPNRPLWDDVDYEAIAAAGVRHVLVRSDCYVAVFERLADMGVVVYLQFTDYFARRGWANPGIHADRLFSLARMNLPRGGYVILDNEPDLGHGDQAQWYAEQWCRWYRALYNEFRFWDHEGRYKAIMPALTAPLDEARLAWWRVGAENVDGHAGVGIHVYWDGGYVAAIHDQIVAARSLRASIGAADLYVLEFGSPAHAGEWRLRQSEYLHLGDSLTRLPGVAFAFILNPTPDWAQYAISGEQLVELARAWRES